MVTNLLIESSENEYLYSSLQAKLDASLKNTYRTEEEKQKAKLLKQQQRKEKCRERSRLYRLKNKEKIAEYKKKQYYLAKQNAIKA